jgi:hypothetical protein
MAKQNTLAITVKAFLSERYFLRSGEVDDSNFLIGCKDNCCFYLTAFFLKNCCNKFLRSLGQDFTLIVVVRSIKIFYYVSCRKKKNESSKSKTHFKK